MAGHDAHHQPRAGAGIPEIEGGRRFDKPAKPRPGYDPIGALFLYVRAERPQSARRAKDVFRLKQTGDYRPALRQRTQHQGAVRDGFVARH